MKPSELLITEYSSFNATYINALEEVTLMEGLGKGLHQLLSFRLFQLKN